MLNIMRFWMNLGLDGFRCDAVPYLYEREGTICENLPETHAFLRKARAMMDTEFPGAIMLAEANQWPTDGWNTSAPKRPRSSTWRSTSR
jgi:maltose alpha-D-glucosyltransferase/alpha-amylase